MDASATNLIIQACKHLGSIKFSFVNKLYSVRSEFSCCSNNLTRYLVIGPIHRSLGLCWTSTRPAMPSMEDGKKVGMPSSVSPPTTRLIVVWVPHPSGGPTGVSRVWCVGLAVVARLGERKSVGGDGVILATEGPTAGPHQPAPLWAALGVECQRTHSASCTAVMAWISTSWWYILSTLSVVGEVRLSGVWAQRPRCGPPPGWRWELLPWPELGWRHSISLGSLHP
jgi:hypothetical protein